MTTPLKRLRNAVQGLANALMPAAVILLYHRVSELSSDAQLLTVTPGHFAEHLDVLRRYYRPASLDQTGRRPNSVVVTFDDGYADNLWNAKPLLERFDVPATVFVTTGYMGQNREFWWDELERLLLQSGPLPESLSLRIGGSSRKWELHGINSYQCNKTWNVLEQSNGNPRHSLYSSLHELLRSVEDTERQQALHALFQWAGFEGTARPTYRALSADEVVLLATGGLVEIGAHTVTHPVLSTLADVAQYREIQQSKTDLEEILGAPIQSFAYPYGSTSDYTAETVAAVRKLGFTRACSNFAGTVGVRSDRFQLPRFLVRDWDGEEFSRRLDEWLNPE